MFTKEMVDPKVYQELEACLDRAFKEDDIQHDITSLGCLPDMDPIEAKLFLKEKARVAGLIFLPIIFQRFDPGIRVQLNAIEGEEYEEGTILAQIIGHPRAILCVERIALNIVSHLSGIANITGKFVEKVKNYTCDILDTRKTLPGLRFLQKYAVRVGGGKNRRLSLSDKILIKNNHLSILKKHSSFGLLEATSHARKRFFGSHVEIEVSDIEFLDEAIAAKPNSILLDHMSPDDVRQAVIRTRHYDDVYLEASGGIYLENVQSYAVTGIDGISIGSLTHSVKAIDMSLNI